MFRLDDAHALARRALVAVVGIVACLSVLATPALAHEVREVAGYRFVVGFIEEPVYTGQKSGLEFSVTRDDAPVTGLADTLQAEVIYGSQSRELPLSPRFGEDGWYQSVFFPTAAGGYTFHIFGTIEGQPIDERFTSGEDTFGEVEEAASGQFPVTLPTASELADDAQRGAAAADLLTPALALGGAGVVLGLVAIAIALAGRRRRA